MGLSRLALLIISSACLCAPTAAVGRQDDEFRHAAECGVYAFAAAAKSLDVDFDITSVLDNMQTSDVPWSTSLDICDSAHKLGLWGAAFHGVTAGSLRSASRPLIVLLKTEMRDECAGHWVAYLGEEQGRAIVFDILHVDRLRKMEYGELSLLMSGEAVMIGVSQPNMWEHMRWKCSTVGCLWPLLVVWLMALLSRFNSYLNTRNLMVQIGVLLLASACLVAFNAFLSRVTLSSEPALVAWVHSKHMGDTFPEVQLNQLIALQRRGQVTVVDARLPAQFAAGHIADSINLPVSIHATELAKRAQLIPRDQLVIVYCHSRDCDWDQTVARRLSALGFTNVRVFEDGIKTYAQQVWQTTP